MTSNLSRAASTASGASSVSNQAPGTARASRDAPKKSGFFSIFRRLGKVSSGRRHAPSTSSRTSLTSSTRESRVQEPGSADIHDTTDAAAGQHQRHATPTYDNLVAGHIEDCKQTLISRNQPTLVRFAENGNSDAAEIIGDIAKFNMVLDALEAECKEMHELGPEQFDSDTLRTCTDKIHVLRQSVYDVVPSCTRMVEKAEKRGAEKVSSRDVFRRNGGKYYSAYHGISNRISRGLKDVVQTIHGKTDTTRKNWAALIFDALFKHVLLKAIASHHDTTVVQAKEYVLTNEHRQYRASCQDFDHKFKGQDGLTWITKMAGQALHLYADPDQTYHSESGETERPDSEPGTPRPSAGPDAPSTSGAPTSHRRSRTHSSTSTIDSREFDQIPRVDPDTSRPESGTRRRVSTETPHAHDTRTDTGTGPHTPPLVVPTASQPVAPPATIGPDHRTTPQSGPLRPEESGDRIVDLWDVPARHTDSVAVDTRTGTHIHKHYHTVNFHQAVTVGRDFIVYPTQSGRAMRNIARVRSVDADESSSIALVGRAPSTEVKEPHEMTLTGRITPPLPFYETQQRLLPQIYRVENQVVPNEAFRDSTEPGAGPLFLARFHIRPPQTGHIPEANEILTAVSPTSSVKGQHVSHQNDDQTTHGMSGETLHKTARAATQPVVGRVMSNGESGFHDSFDRDSLENVDLDGEATRRQADRTVHFERPASREARMAFVEEMWNESEAGKSKTPSFPMRPSSAPIRDDVDGPPVEPNVSHPHDVRRQDSDGENASVSSRSRTDSNASRASTEGSFVYETRAGHRSRNRIEDVGTDESADSIIDATPAPVRKTTPVMIPRTPMFNVQSVNSKTVEPAEPPRAPTPEQDNRNPEVIDAQRGPKPPLTVATTPVFNPSAAGSLQPIKIIRIPAPTFEEFMERRAQAEKAQETALPPSQPQVNRNVNDDDLQARRWPSPASETDTPESSAATLPSPSPDLTETADRTSLKMYLGSDYGRTWNPLTSHILPSNPPRGSAAPRRLEWERPVVFDSKRDMAPAAHRTHPATPSGWRRDPIESKV